MIASSFYTWILWIKIKERRRKKYVRAKKIIQYIYIRIKINCRSLFSLKLKNCLTDFNLFFFFLFALIQGLLKIKNNRENPEEKLNKNLNLYAYKRQTWLTDIPTLSSNHWVDLADILHTAYTYNYLWRGNSEKNIF